jgi:CheY-like chemotaxis protein
LPRAGQRRYIADVLDAPIRVLIVEDDRDICSLFEAGLAMRGYTVQTASNGHDALAMLAPGHPLPSVIVADLHMPVMDGWQFLAALAEDPRLSAIPVVVLTAADDPSKSVPRPSTILIKPVTMDHLEAAITEAAQAALR